MAFRRGSVIWTVYIGLDDGFYLLHIKGQRIHWVRNLEGLQGSERPKG